MLNLKQRSIDDLSGKKPLMVEWLRRWCLRDKKCIVHDLEVMDSNPSRVDFGLRGTFVYVIIEPPVSSSY